MDSMLETLHAFARDGVLTKDGVERAFGVELEEHEAASTEWHVEYRARFPVGARSSLTLRQLRPRCRGGSSLDIPVSPGISDKDVWAEFGKPRTPPFLVQTGKRQFQHVMYRFGGTRFGGGLTLVLYLDVEGRLVAASINSGR
jgi:hypothetical protein